jgi:hypothetical protein
LVNALPRPIAIPRVMMLKTLADVRKLLVECLKLCLDDDDPNVW